MVTIVMWEPVRLQRERSSDASTAFGIWGPARSTRNAPMPRQSPAEPGAWLGARAGRASPSLKEKVIATNSRAFHDYFIEESYEAGISLVGTEVKALREGRVNLRDSFARVEDGEVYLYQCHISPYSHGNISNHDPLRRRKLLLHREEIRRLFGKAQIRGYALLPTKIYFKNGLAKVELALGKGKKSHDKREAIKKKEAHREISRAVKARQTS